MTFAFAGAALAALILFYFLLRVRSEYAVFRARYSGIVDLDKAREERADALQRVSVMAREASEKFDRDKGVLQGQYGNALEQYERLRAEIALLEENVEDISFGLYHPHFDFQSSEEYKAAMEAARDRQKALVRDGRAATCDANWSINNSQREGERMAKQNIKLFLRAFNAECDAAIGNVAWNNATKMEERIRKSFDALNKLGTVLQVAIRTEYMQAKLDELRLVYEHERKRQEEKEEQRRIREQIREEERAQRELAKAQEDAEKEERRYEKALANARLEAARATGEQLGALTDQIVALEAQLAEAHAAKERAKSMAEQTRAGFVYVISNVGAFGEGVFKVGMTRRLEPMDRIAELGDASVPFPFDVHAMLYSDDAPTLERSLHAQFGQRRVNLVNPRKEFFTVDLREVEAFAKERGIDVEFTLVAEAREHHETLAIRREAERANQPTPPAQFTADPFAPAPIIEMVVAG